MNKIICEANREARTIVFHIRDGFGDDRDSAGLKLVPGSEKRSYLRMFEDVLDAFIKDQFHKSGIARWSSIRYCLCREAGERSEKPLYPV